MEKKVSATHSGFNSVFCIIVEYRIPLNKERAE